MLGNTTATFHTIRLDFFARTNKLVNYDFIELPAGREVAIYG